MRHLKTAADHRKRTGVSLFAGVKTVMLALALAALAAPAGFAAVTDGGIATAVETRLTRDDAVQAQKIDVSVQDGVVTLGGRVDYLDAAQRAVRVAMTVKGVRSVVDRIETVPTERADQDIRLDIRQALRLDPVADADAVEVDVDEGQVFLTGRVDSWQERKLTGEAVKGVRGVREVVNRLEVTLAPERPDREMANEIEARLAWDAWVEASSIEVGVSDGAVALSGTVGSLAEKHRAAQDAWIAGVRAVDDTELLVDWERHRARSQPRPQRKVSDRDLTQAVKAALRYDARIEDAGSIEVQAANGIVTLQGLVDRLSASRAAREDAENTYGVWRVRNFIKVRPSVSADYRPLPDRDTRLAEQVRLALLLAPALRQHKISVSVNNGVALLEGRVMTKAARERAADAAAGIRGVVRVVNRLAVVTDRPAAPREDWQLRQDIVSELAWSPFVDADDIHVAVEDGVAVLTGVVDDLRARRTATANARDGGAIQVRNHLKVRNGPDFLQP